jgi:chromosome segregation ATPase
VAEAEKEMAGAEKEVEAVEMLVAEAEKEVAGAEKEMEAVEMVVVEAEKEVAVVEMVVAAAEKEVEAVEMEVVEMEVVEGGITSNHLYKFHNNNLKVMDIHCHKTHNDVDQSKNLMSNNICHYNK